jgi:two-component system, response regulator PdtaR
VTGTIAPFHVMAIARQGCATSRSERRPARSRRAARRRETAPHAKFEALEAEVDRVQQALEDRKLVERAKSLLMPALNLSEQDAFRRLQLTARERNLRLADVAARIVEQQSLLEPKRKRAVAN